ncbi:Patatin-like phospholipase domain-containing protein 2 [Gryllus bimaculatus]|nr:Patatin-like phospholipase domain-containing protein 2 [Gryllus bimaculatus]
MWIFGDLSCGGSRVLQEIRASSIVEQDFRGFCRCDCCLRPAVRSTHRRGSLISHPEHPGHSKPSQASRPFTRADLDERNKWEQVLPDNAHLLVNGKLHISLTRVYDGKNVIVSHFNSKEDLLQALLASCFVPVFSGLLPPRFHGIRYMDGGFSDNLPTLDENTITVSPFCGESDICPRDPSSQLFHVNVANTSIELSKENMYRFTRILFPPKPEVLASMCQQGYEDALSFLHRNKLINCTRCLAVQSTFILSSTPDENLEYDPQCRECKKHRQEAMMGNLPDTILTVFQDAIESANKGLINWIFKHRSMKLLSVLSLPCTLPADIIYATFTKFMRAAPDLGNNLLVMSKFLVNQLTMMLNNLSQSQQLSADVTCQMSLTNYSDDMEADAVEDSGPPKNNVNFNFTLNYDNRELPGQITPQRGMSRWPSMTVNRQGTDMPMDNDTFEHILQVTSHHEAVMAFYYMDEDNKVKVTEIFDVTDADTSAMLSPEERENNTRLEFDGDWNEPLVSTWTSQQTLFDDDLGDGQYSTGGFSDASYEDGLDLDSGNIFSDPESEWNANTQGNEHRPEKASSPLSLPESDQPKVEETQRSRKNSFVIMK